MTSSAPTLEPTVQMEQAACLAKEGDHEGRHYGSMAWGRLQDRHDVGAPLVGALFDHLPDGYPSDPTSSSTLRDVLARRRWSAGRGRIPGRTGASRSAGRSCCRRA